ncbi:TIGR04086 family membrane protein [Paenibacillus koleovorans]|uniref:TIGR04086 family membrane protein n=1 Tax=Paenibacillus koleovorans TaxID=121608 RepID=UPI0013E35372|nr:TIGR04086 family membrane protein [Paenibacillus koleovorans]
MNSLSKVPRLRITSPLLSGLVNATICLLLGMLLLSLLLAFTDFKEQSVTAWVYMIHAISSAIGGIGSGKRAVNKGWYNGGIAGLIYGIIVLLTGFLGLDAHFDASTIAMLVLTFASGALGGMIGVNRKK